jgi:hypothetical protein
MENENKKKSLGPPVWVLSLIFCAIVILAISLVAVVIRLRTM